MKTILTVSLAICGILSVGSSLASAQSEESRETLYISPLFEYPQAPDTMGSIYERSDYIVSRFWDKMDFKNRTAVDQNALNDAFQVFISPMRWSSDQVTDKALNKLLSDIAKNPTLQIQFTRAAEASLYGPRAIYWHDPVYLKFVNALLANKKIPDSRKERYKRHKTLIENTLIGKQPKSFDYVTPTGNTARYEPTGVLTVIEFGDPGCDECRYAKLKMETDVTFSDMVDRGKINVMFIIPDPEDGWQTLTAGFSPKWHVGASEKVADIYDLRAVPSFYVIGRDGNIIAKNIGYAEAMAAAVQAVREAESK